jgi:hypothetical protein
MIEITNEMRERLDAPIDTKGNPQYDVPAGVKEQDAKLCAEDDARRTAPAIHHVGNKRARRTRCSRLVGSLGIKPEHTTMKRAEVTCPQCRKPNADAISSGEFVDVKEVQPGDRVIVPVSSTPFTVQTVDHVEHHPAGNATLFTRSRRVHYVTLGGCEIYRLDHSGWYHRRVSTQAKSLKPGIVIVLHNVPVRITKVQFNCYSGKANVTIECNNGRTYDALPDVLTTVVRGAK